MIYRVRGMHRDTNALMVVDFEAVNKAAAEYKATARGIVVTGVEDITAEAAEHPTSRHRGEGPPDGSTPDAGGTRNLIVVAILLTALAIVGYFMLPLVLETSVPAPPPPPPPSE